MRNTEKKIEELTKVTHTPRGEYGATDENYARLSLRLNTKPVRIVPMGKTRAKLWHKVTIAASILIISSIGYAMIKEYVIKPNQRQTRTMNYDETPLRSIIAEIEAEYGVVITVDDTTRLDYKVTAAYDTDEALDEILNSLSAASGTTIKEEK